MAKDKKKHAKKDKLQVPDSILDAAALSVKKYRKVTKQIGKLSTGQKVVGSIALLAAGLTYLAKSQTATTDASEPRGAALLAAPEAEHAAGDAPPASATVPRKITKARKLK